jgi:hypothetical protein
MAMIRDFDELNGLIQELNDAATPAHFASVMVEEADDVEEAQAALQVALRDACAVAERDVLPAPATKAHRAERMDPHRPSAIVPAEYRYVLSYALASTYNGWPVRPINVDRIMEMRRDGVKFAAHGGLGKCTVCGAAYIHGDVWLHEPTGENIHIGHDCALKYQLMADRSALELELGRRRAAAARQLTAKINAERRHAFFMTHPGLEADLEIDHHIVRDIKARFHQYFTLSDKQIALVRKIAEETRNPRPAEKHIPAPTGKVQFEGEIVGAKVIETGFGSAVKITVKVETSAGSWLAYGTCPAAILDSVQPGQNGRCYEIKGRRASLKATLKRSDRDAHFCFMKRPTGHLV